MFTCIKVSRKLFIILITIQACLPDSDNLFLNWNYREFDAWPGLCISGDKRSPVDLANTQEKKFPHLKLEHSQAHITGVKLRNTGHGLEMLVGDQERAPVLSGGPLTGEYKLQRIEFHWGREFTPGSEHEINDNQYFLEVQLFFRNMNYNSDSEALKHWDGFSALSVLYERVPFHNKHLDPVLMMIEEDARLRWYGAVKKIEDFSISSLIPENADIFYTYNGSLTRPNCEEVVTWIVFDKKMTVHEKQLKILRLV